MTSGRTNFNSWMAVQSKSRFQAGSLKKGSDWQKRTTTPEWGNWRGPVMCKTKLSIADNHPTWWAAGHSAQVSQRWSAFLCHSPSPLIETSFQRRPASSHVSPPHRGAVLTSRARRWGMGRKCQVRGELPRQMQRGAVRRHAAVHSDGPGWLRLLPGLCSRERGALLPHSVRHARGEVRTGIILWVLQGWGRLWRRIRGLQRCVDIQRYSVHLALHVCLCAAFHVLSCCTKCSVPLGYYSFWMKWHLTSCLGCACVGLYSICLNNLSQVFINSGLDLAIQMLQHLYIFIFSPLSMTHFCVGCD